MRVEASKFNLLDVLCGCFSQLKCFLFSLCSTWMALNDSLPCIKVFFHKVRVTAFKASLLCIVLKRRRLWKPLNKTTHLFLHLYWSNQLLCLRVSLGKKKKFLNFMSQGTDTWARPSSSGSDTHLNVYTRADVTPVWQHLLNTVCVERLNSLNEYCVFEYSP